MTEETLEVEGTPVPEESSVEQTPAEPTEAVEAQAEGEQPEAEAAPAEEEDTKPKKRGVQKRIDELTAARHAEKERADQLQQQLWQIQQQQVQQQHAGQKPTLEQFGYDEAAYQQAVEQWAYMGMQQQQRAYAEQQRAMQAQQAEIERTMSIQQMAVKATEKYPDFQEKVFDPSLPPMRQINNDAFEMILQSDQADDVAYYLANNPAEVYGFQGLSVQQTARKLAGIEAKLAAKPRPVEPPPAPPSKLKSRGEAVKDRQKMTTEEWMAWRNAQLKGN